MKILATINLIICILGSLSTILLIIMIIKDRKNNIKDKNDLYILIYNVIIVGLNFLSFMLLK